LCGGRTIQHKVYALADPGVVPPFRRGSELSAHGQVLWAECELQRPTGSRSDAAGVDFGQEVRHLASAPLLRDDMGLRACAVA
jgi:hypothetical protein